LWVPGRGRVAIGFAANVPGVDAIAEWPAILRRIDASSDDGVPWLWIGIGAVLAVIGVSAGVVAASGGGDPSTRRIRRQQFSKRKP
jgi:hypothetical protein